MIESPSIVAHDSCRRWSDRAHREGQRRRIGSAARRFSARGHCRAPKAEPDRGGAPPPGRTVAVRPAVALDRLLVVVPHRRGAGRRLTTGLLNAEGPASPRRGQTGCPPGPPPLRRPSRGHQAPAVPGEAAAMTTVRHAPARQQRRNPTPRPDGRLIFAIAVTPIPQTTRTQRRSSIPRQLLAPRHVVLSVTRPARTDEPTGYATRTYSASR